MISKRDIISHFYNDVYRKYLYTGGPQQAGTAWASKLLENQWTSSNPSYVLEIGGGHGEHLKYVTDIPTNLYVSMDIRTELPEISTIESLPGLKKVLRFDVGNVENLTYENATFNRISGTCVLHHLEDPLKALLEIRRVAANGSEICFVLPTDPGILNRLAKRAITFRKLRKLSEYPPELFYALDHQNHIESLIQIFKFVFREDQVQIKYSPFKIRTWNLNFLVTMKATVNAFDNK